MDSYRGDGHEEHLVATNLLDIDTGGFLTSERFTTNPRASTFLVEHLASGSDSSSHPMESTSSRRGIDAVLIDQIPNPIRRVLTPPALSGHVCHKETMIDQVSDHFAYLPYVDVSNSDNQHHFRLFSPNIHEHPGLVNGQVPSRDAVNAEATIRLNGVKPVSTPVVHRGKTFLAIAILACAWMMNDLVLAWVHERVPYHSDPLPDIWFSVFPEYQSAIKLTEALLITSLLTSLAIMIFHRQRWLVTRRVFFISALCYFGRAFCITLTQVPVPSRRTYCAPKANDTSVALIFKRVGWTLSGLGMDTLYTPRELCGDLIYSGHTTILCLCYLTVSRYAPRNIRWLRHLSQAMALVGVIGILIARKHYTLDVVMAYYVTTRIYWMYHTLADNKSTFFIAGKRPGPRGDVTNVFWAPILRFLESDAPQHVLPIVNQFDTPFRSSCQSVASAVKKMATNRPRDPLAVFSTSFWLRWTNKANNDATKGRAGKNAIFLSV